MNTKLSKRYSKVTFANGGNISFVYDSTGIRLSKKVQPNGGALVTTDYIGGFQYKNNVLQFFPHAEGYVKRNENNTYLYVYQYKDHLGNVRLSYADINKNGTIEPASEILEENNYYPFGLLHKGYNNIANSNRSEQAERYKFNGMEWQPELGLDLYDFGARNYDAAIGRWFNVDPLAEQTMTPYQYVSNNPIMFIDPTGMNHHDYEINEDGTFTKIKDDLINPDRVFNSKGEFVELEYSGQIKDMKQYGETSVMEFNDASKSTEAFEFFAKNSDVEWGRVKTDNSSYVLTDKDPLSVSATAFAYSFLLSQGKDVTDIEHSHPVHIIGGESPSGYGHNPTKNNMYSEPNPYKEPYGDYKALRTLIYGTTQDGHDFKGFGDKARNINFRVYNPVDNTYIKYDEQKAIKQL